MKLSLVRHVCRAYRVAGRLTERGLYGTLNCLSRLGLLAVDLEPGRRTGASRHRYGVTPRGVAYLHSIQASQVG